MKVSSVMRTVSTTLVSLALTSAVAMALAAQTAPAGPGGAARYPASPRGTQVDDLNGVRIPDPYRWLESIGSSDVRAWVSAQNAATESYLAQGSRRNEVRDLLTRAWRYPKVGAPFAAGERLFFYENSGLENQPALYVQERFDAVPRVLIDANAFSKDGLIAIVDQSASPDGRYLAYSVSTQGSAWRTVRVREVRTNQDLSEELEGVKGSRLAWTKDERGFFYVRADVGHPASSANPLAPDGRQRVFYHRVGRRQSEDQLMYESLEHPDWRLRAEVSEDGQYLVISARAGTELHNRLYFIDLDNPRRPNLGAPIVKLFDGADALYEFAASEGPVFFIRTSKGAPRTRLVGVDINAPDMNHWTTVVRETYDPLIEVRRVDDRIVAHRLHDAQSVLELYSLDGGARGTVQLPGAGTVTELNGRAENRQLYFTYTSFLQPPTPYRYDLDTRNVIPYKQVWHDTTMARYETTRLFFTSKDGTRVPMFITARRGITLDGTRATLLTGEGSFGATATPVFTPEITTWLELGGIYAVANVRGGGEDGRAWHVAAAGPRKTVAIDDFISAAEFLINQRYTRSSLLAVSGHGHGGLLVGAAIVRRPELFGAALLDAGLFDMARFTRFTEGPSWTSEYGSPDRPVDLQALLAYSPLHNVVPGVQYPPMLLTVGEHDDVVTPTHSYKFAASVQAAQSGANPVLLRVDFDVGHGPGTPSSKLIALSADRLAFLVQSLRLSR